MSPQHLDPVSVSTALLAVAFGPQMAAVIGPYAVIVLAATTGAAWGLAKADTKTRTEAALYFLRLNTMAVLLTVAFEQLLHSYFPELAGTHWALAPIALLVGGVGDSWPAIGRWVVQRIGRLVSQRTGTDGDTP